MWEMQRVHQSLWVLETLAWLVVEPTSLLVLASKHSINGQIVFSFPSFHGEETKCGDAKRNLHRPSPGHPGEL